MNTFDEYGRNAQLKPGLVAFLPLTLSLVAWAGTGSPILKAIGTILATSGGTYALAMVARNKGRNLQKLLWDSWGGSPTTQLLRHNGTGNPVLREMRHRYLEKLLGRNFPTPEEESADPRNADAIYEAATRILINERRNKTKYPLIFRENVNYGFCRNLCALRGIGIATAIIGIGACIACGIDADAKGRALPWGCATISAIILLIWCFLIRHDWVKPPAQAYAERLLESCDGNSPKKTATKKRKNPAKSA